MAGRRTSPDLPVRILQLVVEVKDIKTVRRVLMVFISAEFSGCKINVFRSYKYCT